MGKVTNRTSQTSQGFLAISPWDGNKNSYAYSAINLGSNFISKLEIVSSLNCLNIGRDNYHYKY